MRRDSGSGKDWWHKSRIGFVLLVFLGLVLVPGITGAAAPNPVVGKAVVDGNYGEWDLAEDFYGNMYNSDSPAAVKLGEAYVRYDCKNNVVYVLVLNLREYPTLAAGWEPQAYAAFSRTTPKLFYGNTGNNGAPPDFMWVGRSADGTYAEGYEASFYQAQGSFTNFFIRAQAAYGTPNSPMATIGFWKNDPLILSCPPAIHVEKKVSVDGGTTWLTADTAPGPEGSGANVRFRLEVNNNGPVTLSGPISLTDSEYGLGGCSVPGSLSPYASFTCEITTTPAGGQHRNVASVTAKYGSNVLSDTDDAYYSAPESIVVPEFPTIGISIALIIVLGFIVCALSRKKS